MYLFAEHPPGGDPWDGGGREGGSATGAGLHRGEKSVWQRRVWEHAIRDEDDWRRHIGYVHYNPVKHGYVERPGNWRWSSFSRAVRNGWYPKGWGDVDPPNLGEMDLE